MTDWDDVATRRGRSRRVEVRCSAGTYIRALARDLGETLGSGAYLGALTRTASGPFRLEQASTDRCAPLAPDRRASRRGADAHGHGPRISIA